MRPSNHHHHLQDSRVRRVRAHDGQLAVLTNRAQPQHVQVPVGTPIPVEAHFRGDRFRIVLRGPVVVALARSHHHLGVAAGLFDATVDVKVGVTTRMKDSSGKHVRVDDLGGG